MHLVMHKTAYPTNTGLNKYGFIFLINWKSEDSGLPVLLVQWLRELRANVFMIFLLFASWSKEGCFSSRHHIFAQGKKKIKDQCQSYLFPKIKKTKAFLDNSRRFLFRLAWNMSHGHPKLERILGKQIFSEPYCLPENFGVLVSRKNIDMAIEWKTNCVSHSLFSSCTSWRNALHF